jgi:hypothetical protein
MAILLYEESVVARLGTSVLSVQPFPHIRDNDLDEYIGMKVGFYSDISDICVVLLC